MLESDELVKKWAKTGLLLAISNPNKKRKIAALLEDEARKFLERYENWFGLSKEISNEACKDFDNIILKLKDDGAFQDDKN